MAHRVVIDSMAKVTRVKELKCPVCGRRIIDEREGDESEAFPVGKEPPGWDPDYCTKCNTCKNEIGIRKIKCLKKYRHTVCIMASPSPVLGVQTTHN
jgi:hypothetical protein